MNVRAARWRAAVAVADAGGARAAYERACGLRVVDERERRGSRGPAAGTAQAVTETPLPILALKYILQI